jgi:sigma-B regulation protein RsbU (phosphoserine phosphatase)
MQTPALLVVTDAGEDRTAALLGAVLDGWQPAAERLTPYTLNAHELLADPSPLDDGGVVWLVLDEAQPAVVYELLDLIDQRHLGALLTRADETQPLGAMQQDGVTICPPDTEPRVCCAMLQSLAAQAGLVRALNGELKLLKHQGGVCDRMSQLDEELRLAAQLQQQFLPPQLPSVGDVSLHALWRPAHYVSGDIYDVARLDEHHLGLFLADAVGHGVPAALMTMYIKRSLRTKVIDANEPKGYRLLEPAETLTHLNRDMIQAQNGKVNFATAVYGVLDCRTNELHLARAGHPHPMVLQADGTMQALTPDGALLGVFEDAEFEQSTITLQPDDRLLLYSDGFELAFPESSEAGQRSVASEQYTEAFRRMASEPAEAALDRLSQQIDAHHGSLNQQDDLTVLCASIGRGASHTPGDADQTHHRTGQPQASEHNTVHAATGAEQ